MKTQSSPAGFIIRHQSLLAASFLMALPMSPASAATLYWDGTGTTWTIASNWSSDSAADTPDPVAVPGAGDDLVFNIPTLNANQTVGFGGLNQAARSLTFNSTGTVVLGNAGGNKDLILGSGGMTLATGAGAATVGNSGSGSNVFVRLGTSQTWTNNSTAGLTSRNITSGLATGTDPVTLTLSATNNGVITNSGALNDGAEGAVVSLIVDSSGTGTSNLSGGNFSGGTTIKSGVLSTNNNLGTGAVLLGHTSGTSAARLNVTGTVSNSLAVQAGSMGGLSMTGGGTNDYSGTILLANHLTVGSLSGSGQTLNISGVISGTGNLTAARLGSSTPTVVLTGANTFAGVTTIDSAVLVVNSLNRVSGGSASSSLGAAPVDVTAGIIKMSAVSASTLRYAGIGESTDRVIEIASSSGATLQQVGTGHVKFEGNITMSGTGSRTLTLRGTSEGSGEISGVIQNIGGGSNTGVTKTDAGTWKLSAINPYTGGTSITGGVLEVTKLDAGGVASSIGASTNASGNLTFGGGTLRYMGSGDSTNRIFNVGAAGATFDSSGSGPVSFTNSTAPTHSTTATPRTITLTGTNTGNNTMANNIGNAGAAGLTSIIKEGVGKWILSGICTYTGDTTVSNGTLSLSNAFLSDTSTVDVGGTAFLHLGHEDTDTVAAFKIDGVPQGSGTFDSSHPSGRITGDGALYVAASSDPFGIWIDTFTSLTDPADKTKDADPDFDGLSNEAEFALDGNPSSGAASGKIRSRVETVGAEQALVITLPVRAGATFDNTPGPAADATVGSLTYLISGTNDLVTFDQGVTEIPVSSGGMPALSGAGWSFRTFRLNGALGGLTSRGPEGFLRVAIESAP